MKRLLFLIVISTLLFSCVSYKPIDPALINNSHEYITELQGLAQNEIYKRALFWISETYNSAESVITFQDLESGVIKGSAIGEVLPIGDIVSRKFNYNISIFIKDEKVKLEFSNVSRHDQPNVGGLDMSMQSSYDAAALYFDVTNENFKQSIVKGINTDW